MVIEIRRLVTLGGRQEGWKEQRGGLLGYPGMTVSSAEKEDREEAGARLGCGDHAA